MTRAVRIVCLVLAVAAFDRAGAFAQATVSAPEPLPPGRPAPERSTPPPPRTPRPNMQLIAEALGVKCAYCHVEAPGTAAGLDFKSDANPKKRIARMMIAMTADINASIPVATLKPAGEAMTVHCMTCHRGLADPRPLHHILLATLQDGTVDVTIARYRELRERYFGRDSYDFSERTLIRLAQEILERGPSAAVALLRTNLEFYPRSVDSYIVMAQAYTRTLQDETAIECLEKALEIVPEHGIAQGYLLQLRQYAAAKKR
jgi:tetratricopeptide (TPR) repeat protein